MSYREFLNKLLLGNEGSSGGASSWDEITDKPSAFPPSAHTHAQADVAGLTDIAAKAHTHANKATLDKFGETNGKPTYDGAEIGGGGDVDESRLLPNVSGLTQADDGKVMQFKFTSAEAEIPVCCNCQALMPGTTDQLVNDSGTGTTLTLGNTLAVSDAVPGPFGNNCVSGIGNDGDNYTISISPRVAFSAADDFTLEWWLRPPTNALNENFLYFCKENGNYDYSWRIYNGAFWQMSSEIIPASEISSLALKANDWNFLVLCRKSGMFRLFINGIRVFSKSWQWAPPESVTFWKFAGGVSGVSNYCGGFRYSRSALYENDFEVPTAPFSVNAGREMVLDFMREATSSKAGAMSAADKAKLDKFDLSNLAVDDLLIGTATGLARITLTDLKAKLDMLATGGNTGN